MKILLIGTTQEADDVVSVLSAAGCTITHRVEGSRISDEIASQGGSAGMVMLRLGAAPARDTDVVPSLRAMGPIQEESDTQRGASCNCKQGSAQYCGVRWSADGVVELRCHLHPASMRIAEGEPAYGFGGDAATFEFQGEPRRVRSRKRRLS